MSMLIDRRLKIRNPMDYQLGIKLPYIVTRSKKAVRKVLSIRRNFAPNDPKKNKIQYFVHFKFLPGLGFYGLGLIHMIGGLSRRNAGSPSLLDAGTLSNSYQQDLTKRCRVKEMKQIKHTTR